MPLDRLIRWIRALDAGRAAGADRVVGRAETLLAALSRSGILLPLELPEIAVWLVGFVVRCTMIGAFLVDVVDGDVFVGGVLSFVALVRLVGDGATACGILDRSLSGGRLLSSIKRRKTMFELFFFFYVLLSLLLIIWYYRYYRYYHR